MYHSVLHRMPQLTAKSTTAEIEDGRVVLSYVALQVLEDAMGQLVLVMRARDERQGMWWTQDIYNWNINSNAPLLAVTLALGDVPKWSDLAAQVQGIVLSNVPNAIASFAPDGVWPEGPSYQGYTAGSLIHGAAALLSATGDDAGWMSAPGICSSGLASMYQTGPSGTYFNFADAHPGTPVTSTLFYLSGTPGCAQYQSIYAAAARSYRSLSPGSAAAEDVMWYSPAGDNSSVPSLPLAAVYADPSLDNSKGAKTHFGSFRSSWSDSNATWVSFKGGQNHFDDHGSDSHNNHGHLDVGNFVLESQGVRWAIDVGPGQYDYPLLAYFGRFRFGYAFVSSETHNVLQFDDDTQHRRGEGRIVATNVGPVPASAAADTPPEASGDAGTKLRGAASPAVATKLDLKAEVPVSMDRATSRGSYGSDALSTSGSSASALRSFSSSDISSPWATVDTSSAYGGSAFVMRNVSMAMAGDAANGGIVTVADTWLHPTASNATFKLHTTQSVSIQGSGAGAYVVLTAPGGVSMKVEASTAAIGVVPAWSTFVLNLAYPQTDTYANLPINVLYATVPASAGSLSVTFTPV